MPSPLPRPHLLSSLRARVTAASAAYVGSVTLAPSLCARARLHHRQLVQIRVERTALELWTYVIVADRAAAEDTVCVNGAAALHVAAGDIVSITAYARSARRLPKRLPVWDALDPAESTRAQYVHIEPADDVTVELAVGKIHRPRVTAVKEGVSCPCVVVDEEWMRQASLEDGMQVHLVNVSNGQRDVLVLRAGKEGTRVCEVHMFGGQVESVEARFGDRSGYQVGDIVIVMAYGEVTTGALERGSVPDMNLCFPYEIPDKDRLECVSILNGYPS